MTLRAVVSVLAVLLLNPLAPGRAAAQEVDGSRPPAVRIAVNLERVKRKLAALPALDNERSLLKLSYYLDVYGRAPRLNLLEGFDVLAGPAPFGGPTHADMRALWTPEEFSSPAIVSIPLGWIFKR